MRLIVEGEAGIGLLRNDPFGRRDRQPGYRIEHGIRHRHDITYCAAVEKRRVLNAQLDTEFVVVVQVDLDQQRLDDDLRRRFVQLFGEFQDLVVIARRGTDQQTVADRLGDNDHLAFHEFDGAHQVRIDLCKAALRRPELIDRFGHILRRTVLQPVDNVLPLTQVALVQP